MSSKYTCDSMIVRNNGLLSMIVTSILFFVVCLTWGTTWIAIRIAVESVPPVTASGLRFLIAFPLLLMIGRAFREPLLFPRSEMGLFVFITVAYFMVPYILINLGEQTVSSGLAALLFSSMPVFIVIFSRLILKDRVSAAQVFGIVIGFASLALILWQRGAEFGFDNAVGVPAILLAAALHAACYVVAKKNGAKIGVVTFNTMPIGLAGVFVTLVGLCVEPFDASSVTGRSVAALAYLGIVASVGGFLAYFLLLKRSNPVLLSFVFLIFPVVSILIESIIENRPVTVGFGVLTAAMLFGFGLTKVTNPLKTAAALGRLADRLRVGKPDIRSTRERSEALASDA